MFFDKLEVFFDIFSAEKIDESLDYTTTTWTFFFLLQKGSNRSTLAAFRRFFLFFLLNKRNILFLLRTFVASPFSSAASLSCFLDSSFNQSLEKFLRFKFQVSTNMLKEVFRLFVKPFSKFSGSKINQFLNFILVLMDLGIFKHSFSNMKLFVSLNKSSVLLGFSSINFCKFFHLFMEEHFFSETRWAFLSLFRTWTSFPPLSVTLVMISHHHF